MCSGIEIFRQQGKNISFRTIGIWLLVDAGMGFFLCPNIKHLQSWACKHSNLYEQISHACPPEHFSDGQRGFADVPPMQALLESLQGLWTRPRSSLSPHSHEPRLPVWCLKHPLDRDYWWGGESASMHVWVCVLLGEEIWGVGETLSNMRITCGFVFLHWGLLSCAERFCAELWTQIL